MSNETIEITLDGDQRRYLPGDTLAGEYALTLPLAAEPKAVEVRVVVYRGKGRRGSGGSIISSVTRRATAGPVDFRQPRRFSTDLPNSPLSYEGVIVKLRWCVRVRLFLTVEKSRVRRAIFNWDKSQRQLSHRRWWTVVE